MTWNSHSYAGLFQTIFYVPTLIIATYLLFFKHGRPRLAWIALTLFCLVRLVGGIILIVYENNQSSVALIIVAIIFQGTGVIPLILSTIGFLRIIISIDYSTKPRLSRMIIILRFFFLVGVALLIAGSVLIGEYNIPNDVSTGEKLVKAGYILLAVILAAITGFDAFFWSQRGSLDTTSRKILMATTASIPLLVVRIVYACLSIFDGTDTTTWSPLYGSIPALIMMHSLMEYLVVAMYVSLGYILPPIGKGNAGTGRGVQVQRDAGVEEHEVGQWK